MDFPNNREPFGHLFEYLQVCIQIRSLRAWPMMSFFAQTKQMHIDNLFRENRRSGVYFFHLEKSSAWILSTISSILLCTESSNGSTAFSISESKSYGKKLHHVCIIKTTRTPWDWCHVDFGIYQLTLFCKNECYIIEWIKLSSGKHNMFSFGLGDIQKIYQEHYRIRQRRENHEHTVSIIMPHSKVYQVFL